MNDAAPSVVSAAPREDSLNRGHEPDAVNHRMIIASVSGLILVLAASLLAVHELIDAFSDNVDVAPEQTLQDESNQSVAEPEFTPNQPQQLEALHRSEIEQLTTYKWTNKKAGVAQIPVERAIDLLAEQGLPATPPVSEQPPDSKTENSDKADNTD